MPENIPGTVLKFSKEIRNNAFATLDPLLSVTKGLTLGQISELTGLSGDTIQNWIKRGWVARPEGKRYGETQVVRIILINMLRSIIPMEQIIGLMEYINGDVEDRDDDIIPDRQLFNYLCAVIWQAETGNITDKEEIKNIIELEISDFKRDGEKDKKKLENVILCMTLAHISAKIKKEADAQIQAVLFDK